MGWNEFIEANRIALDKQKLVSKIEWYKQEKKPIIPEGTYAVSILMIVFDPVYGELKPGYGYDTIHGMYAPTRGRDGKMKKYYDKSNLEYDFMQLYVGKDYVDYGPVYDWIAHWAYMPEMVDGKFVR